MNKLIPLLLVHFSCLAWGADPVVKIVETNPPTQLGMREMVVHKDKDAYLNCVVDNKPVDKDVKWVAWYQINATVVIPITLSLATSSMDPYKHQIDQPTAISWRLKVQHTQVSDEAKYACQVQIGAQNYASDFRRIRVIEAPQIIDLQTSSDQTVDDGEAINLRCNATGRPPPLIKWQRTAGGLLPTGGQEHIGNFLTKPKAQPQDQGSYKCTAVNEAGSNQRKVFLHVKFSPLGRPEEPRIGQQIGYKKELVCLFEAYPIPLKSQIVWSRQGKALEFIGDGYELDYFEGAFSRVTSKVTIHSVQDYDFGEYKCSASNGITPPGVAGVTLFHSNIPTPDRTGKVRSAATLLSISTLTMFMFLSICFLHYL